jgi:hypothetical protein
VTGAEAIYCTCHDDDEVDVRPVYGHNSRQETRCSRCGSQEVVVEQLPPSNEVWRAEQ